MKPTRALLVAGPVLAIASAVFVGAGSAAAVPGPTPNGQTGACNMMMDPSMVTVAMSHDNANGSLGMEGAVDRTGGDCA